eukprot:TRINITY_DN4926_c0_g1_i2.p1 TRINITY_DN4926_c0_g1~~TRINITY_DN4926_c0_g1_i2.p1  ORF type:complete len:499 (+),score=90.22 TRINITY_DN4926_c0_g1_i2:130-1626(+)
MDDKRGSKSKKETEKGGTGSRRHLRAKVAQGEPLLNEPPGGATQRKSNKGAKKRERKDRPVKVNLRRNHSQAGSIERTESLRADALGLGVRLASKDLRGEIMRMFDRPLQQLPVYKDLPRLVMRTTVEVRHKDFRDFSTEEDRKPKSGGRLRKQSSLKSWERRLLCESAGEKGKEVTDSSELEEEMYFAEETTWYCGVATPLPSGDDHSWTEATKQGLVSLVFNETKQTYKIYVYDQEDKKMLAEKVHASRLVSVDGSRYFILEDDDGPVGIVFYTVEDSAAFTTCIKKLDTNTNKLRHEDEADVSQDPVSRLQLLDALHHLVMTIAQELETEETQERIEAVFSSLRDAKNLDAMDMSLVTKDIIEKGIGTETRTAMVLKGINQNMIFFGAYELKTKVTKQLMTKDVRSKDGWTIHVLLAPNVIVVTHTKREMALTSASTQDAQFTFEWQLTSVFHPGMNRLEAVWLRITKLEFTPETSEDHKRTLSQVFCNGQLHVY